MIWVAFGAYLLMAVLVWWNVWSKHPSAVAPCSCSDPALVTWFMAWPAHALLHGLSPFYSSDMFHPTGINLLSNASSLALGIPLAPVTWLFGPVATLNVAATLTPALSALAMFWLLRRWVRWVPAAFVGGIVYGFSPLMLSSVAISHLMTAALMVPPLIVACLDELLVRQRRPPGRVGLLLGVLLIVQFFLGTEILAVMVVAGTGALVLLVAYGLLSEGHSLPRRLPHALRGLVTAAGVAVVALVYPVWFLLSGPAHLSGQVWGSQVRAGAGGIDLHALWSASYPGALSNYVSGYRGRPLPAVEYLGPGLLLVIAAGTAVWRRDRRLWFFGAFGLINIALSIGKTSTSLWVPWKVLAKIPFIQNIIPERFMALTFLCVAAALAIVIDRTHSATEGVFHQSRRYASSANVLAGVGGLIVALVALVPVGAAEANALPLAVRRVVVPQWFDVQRDRISPTDVVLAYPFPGAWSPPVLTWQAIDRMEFAVAGGGGPGSIPARAGRERAGLALLSGANWPESRPADASGANVRAVRAALAGWGVTTIVVPDPTAVPATDRGWRAADAVGLVTAAVGRLPTAEDAALVWTDVQSSTRPVALAGPAFQSCAKAATNSTSSLVGETRCVMAAAKPLG